MLLLVGLGNPGPQYARNRHNVGFLFLQALAQRCGLPTWRKKFDGVFTEGDVAGTHVALLLPATLMNLSGTSVRQAFGSSNLHARDVIAFHDDIESSFCVVKTKIGGGSAGHNGLRSLSGSIGSDFRRVRIGVDRPPAGVPVDQYVLSDFSKYEMEWLGKLFDLMIDSIGHLLHDSDFSFDSIVNTGLRQQGFVPRPKRSR